MSLLKKLVLVSFCVLILCLAGTAQATTIDLPGLLGYWTCDGDVLDSTAHAGHGTWGGSSAYVAGKFGGSDQAVRVVRNTTRVTLGDSSGGSLTWYDPGVAGYGGGASNRNITLSLWTTCEVLGASNSPATLLSIGEKSWSFGQLYGNTAKTEWRNIVSAPVYFDNVADWMSGWHFVVAEMVDLGGDTGRSRVYVDGVEVYNQTAPFYSHPAICYPTIGANPGSEGRGWTGNVDDVAIWSRALSTAEIAFLYNGGAGRPVSEIPEPSTLALLAAGLLGLLCYAWRKRKCAPR